MSSHLRLDDGTTWPNPADPGDVQCGQNRRAPPMPDACSCGYTGPQSHCYLCHTTGLTTAELLAHMAAAHDVDLTASAERWPDGELVVVDTTLQPEDFR